MNVIKINHYDYLVPEGVDAGKLLSMLSKLEPCDAYWHQNTIYLASDDEEQNAMIKPLKLQLTPVPAKTKFVVKEGAVEQPVEVSQKTGKRAERPMPKPKRMALKAPSQQTFLLGGPRR